MLECTDAVLSNELRWGKELGAWGWGPGSSLKSAEWHGYCMGITVG